VKRRLTLTLKKQGDHGNKLNNKRTLRLLGAGPIHFGIQKILAKDSNFCPCKEVGKKAKRNGDLKPPKHQEHKGKKKKRFVPHAKEMREIH